MWWHAKKTGSDNQIDVKTVLHTLEAPVEKLESEESPKGRTARNAIQKRMAFPDSACDETPEQHPVQALLKLSKSNPSLYKV